MAKEIATKTKLDTRIAADIAAAMPVANQPSAAKAAAAQVAKKAIVIDTEEVQAAVEQTVEGSADVIVAQAAGATASAGSAAAGGAAAAGISTTALVVAGVAVAAAASSSSSSSPAPAASTPATTPTTPTTPAVVEGQVFTLTTGTDNFGPTSGVAGNKSTDGNDTFRAVTSGELTSADVINAGGGTDTLNATQTGAAAGVTIKPLLTSVEVINFTVNSGATDANSATFDLGDSTGVQEIILKDAVSVNHATNALTVTFDKMLSGVKGGISGGTKGSTGGLATNVTFGVKDAATNTADALTIKLNDALANVVTAANIETITLSNSNTTALTSSTLAALTADKLKTLNIEGSGTLTVTALTGTGSTLTNLAITGSGKNTITTATGTQTALKTIDASTATGDNTVVISGTAIANTKVTMGSGADTVRFDSSAEVATAIGTEGKVDGGAGKDALRVTEAALDATDQTNISKALNFEVIDNAYGGATDTTSMTVTASAFTGINEFVFSTANVGKTGASNAAATGGTAGSVGIAVTGVENVDTYVFAANVTGGAGVGANAGSHGASAKGVTFAAKVDSGNDILNITLKGSTTDATGTVELKGAAGVNGDLNGKVGVDATEFETVNISSTGKNDSDTTFANNHAITGGAKSGAGADGAAIVVNTNGKVVITGNKHLAFTGGIDGNNATVDASAFTGMLKVTTNSGNNTLIGGAQADELTGGAGIDTYTGNGGKDKFIIADTEAGTTGNERVTDFALGTDILDLTGTKTNIVDVVTATSIASANTISGIAAGDTLLATVSKGIVSLTGTAVAKVDTVAEVIEVFKALVAAGTNAEIGAVVANGNTYVVFESNGGNTVADVIQLTGITNATSISTTAATGVITIA